MWSQTFSYDAFGNITKAGTNSFNPGYNTATNRMSTGATYDLNGDVLSDSLHSYSWDVNGRPTTIDSATVTYDALGRMVEQTQAGVSTEIEYSPTGFKLQLLNGQSSYLKQFLPLPGGTGKVWENNGNTVYYQHADWLGSSRFASTPSRTMYNDLAYAPFGEQYAQAGTVGVTNTSFAGNNGDTATNLYDAQFREYEITGRWPSPDPAGIAAANPANPQSWNRYAYVMNNPLALADPQGLWCDPGSAVGCSPNDPNNSGGSLGDLLGGEFYYVEQPGWMTCSDCTIPTDTYYVVNTEPGDLCGGGDCLNPSGPGSPQTPPPFDFSKVPDQQLRAFSACVQSHTGHSPFQVYRMIASGTPPGQNPFGGPISPIEPPGGIYSVDEPPTSIDVMGADSRELLQLELDTCAAQNPLASLSSSPIAPPPPQD